MLLGHKSNLCDVPEEGRRDRTVVILAPVVSVFGTSALDPVRMHSRETAPGTPTYEHLRAM